MSEVWVAFGVALAPWAVLTFVRLKRFLHILQLEEYLTPQYLRWLRVNAERYLTPPMVLAGGGVSILAVLGLEAGSDAAAWGAITAWGLVPVLLRLRAPPHRPRKPLVMTSRARRLMVVALVVAGLVVLAVGGGGLLAGEQEAIALAILTTFVTCLLAGHVLAVANLVLWPLEERGRRRFMGMAARKLLANRPRVIAITGSAGKTTTKDLVAHLLSARYRVLKTPASFNTPLGIARTVNDSYEGQEFFVVEMGAYKRGEIERLCRMVGGADVSVITTVNAQHLERFGSLEATAAAKFEIVAGLRPGGTAVLNFDVAAIRELAKGQYPGLNPGASEAGRVLRQAQDERIEVGQAQDERILEVQDERVGEDERLGDGLILREPQDERAKVLSFGVEWEEVGLRGTNVVETQTGIELDVTYGDETVHVTTRLLARHNASNVLAALGVGLTCGLDLGYMAAAIRVFEPPEHRLQPMQLENGVTMLDDAYNANPEGIIGALEVLGSYKPRRRVLVTSGLIEMGREKAAYHGRIGRAAAANADVVVLVGPKQTADIRAAMIEASFPAECVHLARNPEEAQSVLGRIGQAGDVILYSTDLPDQFDEFLVI